MTYHVTGELQYGWSYRDSFGRTVQHLEHISLDAQIVGAPTPAKALEWARIWTAGAMDTGSWYLHWISVPIVKEVLDV